MKIVVTGGFGFIGSNFIRIVRNKFPEAEIVNIDCLTYAGNEKNLEGIDCESYYENISDCYTEPKLALRLKDADWIVNFAAESHVDRSIYRSDLFMYTNVIGTFNLLKVMRQAAPNARFLQIGTDEVYGDIDIGFPTEDWKLEPSSPYSASKAAADLYALAVHRTYALDVVVSRCTNNYGPYQFPEKLIPLFITNAIEDIPVPLYDGGTQIRDWIHVEDHCKALLFILERGMSGEIYNVASQQTPEVTNREITQIILDNLGKPESLIEHVTGVRPGHDQRYALDAQKTRDLGWAPEIDLDSGLTQTVRWYTTHVPWWKPLKRKVNAY